MKKAFMVLILLVVLGPVKIWAEGPQVACGSSFLAAIAGDLLGDEISILVLVTPEEEPNQAQEFSPLTIKKILPSRLLLYHPRQTWLKRRVENMDIRGIEIIPLRGSFQMLIPGEYLKAVLELHKALRRSFPEYRTHMEERLAELKERVKTAETETLSRFRRSRAIGTPCLAAAGQYKFAEWLGLKVVDRFGVPSSLNERRLTDMRNQAQRLKIWLVIGNRTRTTAEAAEKVAQEIEGKAVLLYGFPSLGMEGDAPDWRGLLDENAQLILNAIEWR